MDNRRNYMEQVAPLVFGKMSLGPTLQGRGHCGAPLQAARLVNSTTSVHAHISCVIVSLNEFLPRNAVHKRGLLSSGVRASVCLSVTFVYCIQTAEDIVKFLSRSSSPIILVFFT